LTGGVPKAPRALAQFFLLPRQETTCPGNYLFGWDSRSGWGFFSACAEPRLALTGSQTSFAAASDADRDRVEGFPTGRHGSARAAVNRLIAVGKASPGDPVSKAAQALADLYRAQESGLGQGRALSKVTESWRGLDFTQRSRAKLIARHLVRA
jgi:hypothetical protein